MRLILPISLTAPTQPGYDFIGWTKESGNSNLNGNDIVIGTENTIIVANWEKKYIYYSELVLDYKCSNVSAGSSPYIIEYDGECELINDEGDNWVMKLLGDASTHAGTHTFKISSRISIDIFLVGGGGGGGPTNSGYTAYGGGGGGGYTLTATEKLSSYTHSIQIGDGGGVGLDGESTSGFNYTVSGGHAGYISGGGAGGSGGGGGAAPICYSGGKGGSNGGDGSNGNGCEYYQWNNGGAGGKGQISNPGPNNETGLTTEFSEADGTIYSGGGGGKGYGDGYTPGCGAGGTGGGGKCDQNGTDNLGGGGGRNAEGGSGIIVIRNARQ